MAHKNFTLAALVIAGFYLYSCTTVAPVHATYEKAATLGKGDLELSGHYTNYRWEGETTNNNIGFKAGIGISENADIKIRYEKLMLPDEAQESDIKINYMSVIPKFSLVPDKLSIFLPVSMYSSLSKDENRSSTSKSYSVAAHLIRTFTSPSRKVDFSPSMNIEYLVNVGNRNEKSEGYFLMGLNLGAGLSTNLDRWAIRPEVGFLYNPAFIEGYWNFGVGLQFILPTGPK